MTGTGALLAGRYRLDRQIATGGMGVVWAATDEVLGRRVAIKVVKPEYADDPAFRERLQAEARAAASVHDPHVVAIYDVGETQAGGRVESFIVMELLEGRSLAEELAFGSLSPARVANLFADVGTGLAAAHACGVVHRDIKPANLIREPSGRYVVLDFGIARAATAASLTAAGVVLGTARYLSPEQAAGLPAVAASDVYSLGVVAHQCLSGAPPFDAESDIAVALAHLHDPPPPLPASVPAPLAELVQRCLAKEPEKRPTAAELANQARTLAAALEPGEAGVGPAAPTQLLPAAAAAGLGALDAPAGPAATETQAIPGPAASPEDGARTPAWLSSKWLATGAVGGLALIAAVTAIGLRGNSADPATAGPPGPRPSASTAASPVADRSVRVVSSRFVGETWARASARLTAMDLVPHRRTAASGAAPGRVARVSPTGFLKPGSDVAVWVTPSVRHTVTRVPPHKPAAPHASRPRPPRHDKPGHGHGKGPKPKHGPPG